MKNFFIEIRNDLNVNVYFLKNWILVYGKKKNFFWKFKVDLMGSLLIILFFYNYLFVKEY